MAKVTLHPSKLKLKPEGVLLMLAKFQDISLKNMATRLSILKIGVFIRANILCSVITTCLLEKQ